MDDPNRAPNSLFDQRFGRNSKEPPPIRLAPFSHVECLRLETRFGLLVGLGDQGMVPGPQLQGERRGIKEAPTEAALFRLAVKPGYLTVQLPKLNIVSVNQLLGGFDCCVIVIAVENDRSDEMAVPADDVCAVVGHVDSR
jgi:hypothetical protein